MLYVSNPLSSRKCKRRQRQPTLLYLFYCTRIATLFVFVCWWLFVCSCVCVCMCDVDAKPMKRTMNTRWFCVDTGEMPMCVANDGNGNVAAAAGAAATSAAGG